MASLPPDPNTARGRMRLLPPLSEFDKQIGHYKALQNEISATPVSAVRGWLKLDAKPAKQALFTLATKWMFAFTQQLQATVIGALDEIATFMHEVATGLTSEEEEEGDGEDGRHRDRLGEAIAHIHNVREADEEIEEIFEPMRGAVALLKKYGISMSEHSLELLERCPFEWEDTKKLATAARERLAPLHIVQVTRLEM